MIGALGVVTLVLAVAIVAAVAYHLIGIFLALKRGADHLERLAAGLVAIRDGAAPLNGRIDDVNAGLAALTAPLAGANDNLAAILGLVRRG